MTCSPTGSFRVHRAPACRLDRAPAHARDLVQILLEPKNALVKQYQLLPCTTPSSSSSRTRLGDLDKALDRDRRTRPPLDHRAGAPRRHVRAPVAQGRLQVRHHEGDDQARSVRRSSPRAAARSSSTSRPKSRLARPGGAEGRPSFRRLPADGSFSASCRSRVGIFVAGVAGCGESASGRPRLRARGVWTSSRS